MNFSFFYIHVHTAWKNTKLSLTNFFSWNQLFSNFFGKTVTFTKFLAKKCEREFLVFPHCTLHIGKFKNLLSPKNISSNQLFSNLYYIVKSLLSRNFCQKSWENFRNFHTTARWESFRAISTLWHSVEKREIHCHTEFFLSNQLTVKFFSKTVNITKFL